MKAEQGHPGGTAEGPGSLLVLGALSLLVGAGAGLVGALFRLSLACADWLREALADWAHDWNVAGFLLVTPKRVLLRRGYL